MAAGIDDLTDFLLASIALLGVQGAGSKEFYRIIDNYFEESRQSRTGSSLFGPNSSPEALTRNFYEKVWKWVTDHPDIRIYHNKEICHLSLSQFEALETQAQNGRPDDAVDRGQEKTSDSAAAARLAARPSDSMLSLRASLRQRLLDEGYQSAKSSSSTGAAGTSDTSQPEAPASILSKPPTAEPNLASHENLSSNDDTVSEPARVPSKLRGPRKIPKGILVHDPIFDDPPTTLNGPRLFASQNRVWHAVAGHSMDLKRVPAMEFVLLCIIATHKADGIAQPELIRLSGQDKRSVPKRTDMLAQKGYIEKRPCQDRRVHTSLCIHKRYATADAVLYKPCTVDEVFGNGPFNMPGFIYLLHKLLTDSGGAIPMRELRKRMGVSVQNWNKRAARIAVARLVQSGMIKQVQTRRKNRENKFVLCIKVVREPTEEDLRIQKVRRLEDELEQPLGDQIDANAEDDDVLRDMEMELVEETDPGKSDAQKEVDRTPPQWTPERLLCHMIFQVLKLRGPEGGDSDDIREMTTGKFWKRPLESYVSRLTDNVQKSQPHHLRHLSIVRDNTQTEKKKSLHYVYRTHENYKKAVELGEVLGMDLDTPTDVFLDKWGFRPPSANDFHHRTGSSTLSEARPKYAFIKLGPKGYITGQSSNGGAKQKGGRGKHSTKLAPGRPVLKLRETTIEPQDRTITPALLAVVQRKKAKAKQSGTRNKVQPTEIEDIVESNAAEAEAVNAELANGDPINVEPVNAELVGGEPVEAEAVNAEDLNTEVANTQVSNAEYVGEAPADRNAGTLSGKATSPLTMSPETRRAPPVTVHGPLLTMQERRDLGLPLRGRLGKEIEDQIRRDRGLAVKTAKGRKPRDVRKWNEPALLTMAQREAVGYHRTGRMPQALIEELRVRRRLGLPTTDALLDEIKRRRAMGASFTEPPLSEWGRDQETIIPSSNGTETEAHLGQAGPVLMPSPPLSTEVSTSPLPETATTQHSSLKRLPQEDESISPTASKKARISCEREAASQEQSTQKQPTQEQFVQQRNEDRDGQATSPTATNRPLTPEHGPSRPSKRKSRDQDGETESARKKTRMSPRVVSSTRPTRSRRGILAIPPLATPPSGNGELTQPVINPAVEEHRNEHSVVNMTQNLPRTAAGGMKAKYENRTTPGFYYDPYASLKTSTGRGRPRRVFLATFKLPKLRTIDWSTRPSVNVDVVSPLHQSVSAAEKPSDGNNGRPETRLVEITPNGDAEIDGVTQTESLSSTVVVPERTEELARDQGTTSTPSHLATMLPSEVTDSTDPPARDLQSTDMLDTVEALPLDTSVTVSNVPQQYEEVSASAPAQPSSSDAEVTCNPDSAAIRRSNSPLRRLAPAGWTAINAPSRDPSATYQSPYQSPYESTRQSPYQTPYQTPCESPSPEEPPPPSPGTSNNGKEQSASFVPLFNRPLPRTFRKHEKPTPGRWKKLGEGSVQNTRKFVIKQVFDLCDGVFPGNGELPIVIEGVWSELAPKRMLCPDRTTITKTLSQMLGDPKYGRLRRTEIKVRSIEVEKPATRSFYSYGSIALNSPEVQRVRTGICASYPCKYFPPEIAQYVSNDSRPARKAPIEIDDSITIEELFPNRAKRINQRIKELARLRNEEALHRKLKQKKDAEERAYHSREAEKGPAAGGTLSQGVTGKRVRLVGLDQKAKPRQKPVQVPPLIDTGNQENGTRALFSIHAAEFGLQRLEGRANGLGRDVSVGDEIVISSDAESDSDEVESDNVEQQALDGDSVPIMAPTSCFYPSNGTFSTEYNDPRTELKPVQKRGHKRVRIVDPISEHRHNKHRKTDPTSMTTDEVHVSDDEESDEYEPRDERRQKPAAIPDPTLVDRLTGLTGNQSEQDYLPPTKKQKTFPTWNERKAKARAKVRAMAPPQATDSEPAVGHPGPGDRFKKLWCTLVMASSMSGDGNSVNWAIVKSVYSDDSRFELEKVKKTWSWMGKRMATELNEFTTTFQTAFLDAYESGMLDSIEDPDTYDWAHLVQWAMANCKHPQPSLPILREALGDCEIDVSTFEMVDRQLWFNQILSSVNRSNRLLKYPFAAPLSPPQEPLRTAEDPGLKARSWVRANIATPQASYDKQAAHEKLSPLGGDLIEKTVTELVDASFIRRWKLKRLRPGRNYDFAKGFAKKFRRVRELDDFMVAVDMKKKLDLAFAEEDEEQRKYSVSAIKDDGAFMAVLSLVAAGQVKMVTKLPPFTNDFDVPQPKLSIWGLTEGDYRARRIDRWRLKWDVDVVPTAAYKFGSPLQPSSAPLARSEEGSPVAWPSLLPPPLPDGEDTPLPIWSSITGKTVTWPWWNRILNLVLQSLMFRPGATAATIFQACPKYTTEIFEIELILDWLVNVNAARRTDHGTYDLLPGFWGVFGDVLIDDEEDSYGQHVKRTNWKKKAQNESWAPNYNLRNATEQRTMNAEVVDISSEDEHGMGTGSLRTRRTMNQARTSPTAHQDQGLTVPMPVIDPKLESQQVSLDLQIDPALLERNDATLSSQGIDVTDPDMDAEGELDDVVDMVMH